MKRLVLSLALACFALTYIGAQAQGYPTRSTTVIVPFTAGGPADITGRIVADIFTRALGQQFVVENVGGAGGATGTTRVARANPDGYTIGLGHVGTHAAAVALIPNLAYKPDVDDIRESPAFRIMDLIKERGGVVAYHDQHVPAVPPTREHMAWRGTRSVAWDRPTVSSFDATVIVTRHSTIDLKHLPEWSPLIVDTRNAMNGIACQPRQLWKA